MDKGMLLGCVDTLERDFSERIAELRRCIKEGAPERSGEGEQKPVRRTITTARAATILGIAQQTVSRLALTGLLPHTKKGREYRFSGRELAEAKPRIRELVSQLRIELQKRYDSEPEDAMLSVSEANELTGLSPRIIVRLAKEGRVRSVTQQVAKDNREVCVMQVSAKDLRDEIARQRGDGKKVAKLHAQRGRASKGKKLKAS